MNIIIKVIEMISLFILFYFFVVSITYVILIVFSAGRLKRFVNVINNDITVESNYIKPISIIVPAYNEQQTIIDNLESLLNLNYPVYEIVLVNDGSDDDTLKKVVEHFHLRKIDMDFNDQLPCNEIVGTYGSFERNNFIVIDKVNGGKSDALNAGINASKYPLYCAIDADCVIEKNALMRIVKPFLKSKETIAVGGIVRIANGCTIKDGKLLKAKLPRKIIVTFQIVEYFRAFLSSRIGWESMNSLLIISGAFGVFKKSAVIEVGGYNKTIGEDMELTLRLHEYFRKNKRKYKIDFTSDAVCWTQAPDTLRGIRSQRLRWHRGLIDSLLKHKRMLLNPRYGIVGLVSMPYFVFVEMLGPVVETIGYIILLISAILGIVSSNFLMVFLLAYLYGMLFSLAAILLEQFSFKRYRNVAEITKLIGLSFLEQFSYRQFTVFFRVQAFFNFRKGSKTWGTIKRKKFSEDSEH